MKKVLLFVLAAFFACYTMNAQVLFSDGFEGDLSAWTTYDADGDGYEWQILNNSSFSSPITDKGEQCLTSASYVNNSGALTPDNWITTTSPIAIPASGFILKWYDAAQDATYPSDKYSVYIASTGNAIANFTATTPVETITLSTSSWTMRSVDLSTYAGQSIYIAFRHYDCTDWFWFKIDDVEISKPSLEPSIMLSALDLPDMVDANESFDITGTVTNLSSSALTSYEVTYSINGGANVATYTVSGINVALGSTHTFTHNVPATIATRGIATINVTVSNPNGESDETADNTLSGQVIVCGPITEYPYSTDFENGMSEECWYTTNPTHIGNGAGYMQYAAYGLPFATHSGDNAIVATDYGTLYTQVTIPAGAAMATLSGYGMLSYDPNDLGQPSSINVAVSTTGTDDDDFNTVSTFSLSQNSYAEFTADLSAYIGQTIYVGISRNDTNAWILIDDITIETPSNNPEIALISSTTPTNVTVGSDFEISGVVKNNSAAALTSFDVTYTLDGTTSAVMNVTGINVANGGTYEFTHSAAANLATAGNHTLVINVSNPNGVADNTNDNEISSTVIACSTISVPYSYGFENGMNCWQAISMNTENENFGINGGGQYGPQSVGTHTGSNAFIFSSYSSAASGDYTQYLISPELNLTSAAMLTYYYKDGYGEGETMQLMVSTTDNNISSFTALGDEITAPEDWTEGAAAINANVKYIAFKYTSDYLYWLGIDDISLSELPLDPEIELVSAETNPNSVALNTNFNLKGVVKNNSGTPLTSFDLSYTFNNQTFNESISGINVALGQTYNFSIPVTGIATTGDYPITVTVSNPNGVADVTTDNTQNTSVIIYDASTSVPRTVLMENFTTAVCPNCPGGHSVIEGALTGNYANRVIWTAHHSGYYTDALTTTLDQTMMTFYNDGGATYAPAVMLDRTYWGDASFTDNDPGPIFFPGQSSSNMTAAFDAALAEPAFVTVNVATPTYNATTRALSVTVSGNVSGALATDDARLNVWLLEDGLLADGGSGVGHGPSQSGASGTFYHNHVIRENLSGDDWGEANVVNTAAGTNYTKTYTTTVSNNYDASKCYIVAFVSSGNHSNVNNCKVFNAGKSAYLSAGDTPGPQPQGIDDVNAANVKLYPNPTTGNLYIEVEGLQKVEVIDAVGRVVMSQNNGNVINMSNLANGIYTVRVMANGNTAVKKVVKK
ncbi:MAG: choice-of-anchor J domain-containing protein [Bacteroidales bacterium]|nr:choice-of-anchor J domain-containing protein [Bacteroidales bacterium]